MPAPCYTSGVGVILALVTCSQQLEAALACEGRDGVSLVRLAGSSPRSKLVLAAVDLLVEDAGIDRSEVTDVAVTRGPGSFTGIRAGLATAAGLAAGGGAVVRVYDSLTVQAARCDGSGTVWAAQPGRRGELYARRYTLSEGSPPAADGEIAIVAVAETARTGPWVTAECVTIGAGTRARTDLSAAEALIRLVRLGVPPQEPEPLYVEGPPVHGRPG